MCDEWMPALRLALTPEQFRQLPRNAAYRYAYTPGEACLSPAARCYHALLDLKHTSGRTERSHRQEPVSAPALLEDFSELVPVFAEAFSPVQPFAGLDVENRLAAARACLERTRNGGDGPWIERASFVAERHGETWPVGAILVTLLPDTDPADPDSYYWAEQPPADCVARCLGRPHLTWIFVLPAEAGHGTGTALLAACTAALRRLGFRSLASTFLLGNESSMLWHWRTGFQLLSYPWSPRRRRKAHGG